MDTDFPEAPRTQPHPLGMLEMSGPFPLTDAAIDAVLSDRSPGNYALGYQDGATFVVFYVGRSDTDVRARLHDWVGSPSRCDRSAPSAQAPWSRHGGASLAFAAPALARAGTAVDSGYTRFAYSYADSPQAAFEKECRNYEDFGGARGLDNGEHPAATRSRARAGRRARRLRAGGSVPRPNPWSEPD